MFKFVTKKNIYTLCFVMLGAIDLLRGGPAGNIWKAAANCSGLVMMIIIFSAYPFKEFINKINIVYSVICVMAMVFVHFHWKSHIGEYAWGQVQTAVLNIWWMGILCHYMVKKIIPNKIQKYKKNALVIIWVVTTLFAALSICELIWPSWYLLMFALFYMTDYSNEDKKALMDGMIDGSIIAFFGIQIYAYGFRPFADVTERYTGAYANANMAALFYLVIYVMCLFKLHLLYMSKGKIGWKLFYLIGAAGMLCFQFWTMGRTAWICSFAITIVYGLTILRKICKQRWRIVIGKGILLLVLSALLLVPVFYTIRWLPTILRHPVWYPGEYNTNMIHSYDPIDSYKYRELDEVLEENFSRVKNIFSGIEEKNPFVLQVQAKTEYPTVEMVDSKWIPQGSLSIRLTIYKAYLENIAWRGHSVQDGFYYIGDTFYHSWHAQNLWIQIAYYFGIPAGIGLLLLTVIIIVRNVKRCLLEKDNPYAIIPLLISIIFFGYGLMEVVWNPGQLVLFLMFFVQHPQCEDFIENVMTKNCYKECE